jgi:predicted MPP superfamily phosphohydrolase
VHGLVSLLLEMLIHLGMIAAIVALAVYFSSTGSSASSDDSVVAQLTPSGLRFKPDNTFKIVQFTDMHYGEDPTFDAKTDEVQRTILALEQPDFVMVSAHCACTSSRHPVRLHSRQPRR